MNKMYTQIDIRFLCCFEAMGVAYEQAVDKKETIFFFLLFFLLSK